MKMMLYPYSYFGGMVNYFKHSRKDLKRYWYSGSENRKRSFFKWNKGSVARAKSKRIR
jgi:hypothetical protein